MVVAHVPFVGREAQLDALISAVAAAESGTSTLALVAGEPGIGKTRLVTEVAARVSALGSARALWGTCWQGEGGPAYWPWLQPLRALVAEGDADRVGTARLTGWEQVDRLLDQAPSSDVSADARFRLFDSVAELLGARSRTALLVLVLDDLHWADEASIRLLQFLTHDPRRRRLAIIGTYRDTDLEPGHPLAGALGELVREGQHVSLGGLGQPDVAALVGVLGGQGAALTSLVPLLHRLSGGNPLFVRELVRLFEAEGSLDGLGHSSAVHSSMSTVSMSVGSMSVGSM